MERFGRNMARMCAGSAKVEDGGASEVSMGGLGESQGGGAAKGSSKERWAAIRAFIAQTMERREDCVGG
ncbi:hypothetical protein N7G274_010186 [Stereocaulon virgatum]|uniref:Uncharacterized protein n=1 Tax=Stereocaulon virgatum TaxID=373712 RepID=A0ABR3ZV73_9LECA